MKPLQKLLKSIGTLLVSVSLSAHAAEIKYVMGVLNQSSIDDFKFIVEPWEKRTGNTVKLVTMPSSTTDQFAQYRIWLSSGASNIDVYQSDVIWAPQLDSHFVDLSADAKHLVDLHFDSVIESQTSQGRLVALPIFTDAPALYYRKDLLEKYNKPVPQTWQQLTETAQYIQDKERAAGNGKMWGFVWQGKAYEGLTCDALEWVKSYGGGQIVEADGTISINNQNAIDAINLAKSWVGTISPKGVLSYQEEESRGVWQNGNAVFMRNWPYAFRLGNADDSPIKGKFDVVKLPGKVAGQSAATLGGWNVAISKYSKNIDAAKSLALYLASPEGQKRRTLLTGSLPTIISLYDDADIKAKQTLVPRWKQVFLNAVPRPSASTKTKYNEVSNKFFTAVNNSLAGRGDTADNLEILEAQLIKLKGKGW